ncbi:DUF695 domain-containing protein [Lacinutrix jangbogonensis]|uniref:DUF695 domain-containing protein n=1 Tax=Lacinutrix jangbogonensis TaxID=1469557 RepID=UPI00053E7083|nr:DUF695 domain-containing protein [Lacinutrix jangbogonensis]
MGFLSKIFGQSEPKNEYQPDWTFYFSNVNDKLSSIATDLNLTIVAPIKEQENVVYISIKMPNQKDNGLSSSADADELWKIQDEIISRFDKNQRKNRTTE